MASAPTFQRGQMVLVETQTSDYWARRHGTHVLLRKPSSIWRPIVVVFYTEQKKRPFSRFLTDYSHSWCTYNGNCKTTPIKRKSMSTRNETSNKRQLSQKVLFSSHRAHIAFLHIPSASKSQESGCETLYSLSVYLDGRWDSQGQQVSWASF